MTFHVGQKVVCVDASPCRVRGITPNLQEGGVYIVSGLSGYRDPDGDSGVTVHGARVQVKSGYFKAHRFRPIVENETDISIFTALLNPSPAKETERV